MCKLFEKENIGTIQLSDKIRISDPCYSPTTWCAGTIDILPGKYICFSQKIDMDDWGIRIASIEIRHEDYQTIEADKTTSIDVGVDSGQCGIFDLPYFLEMNLNSHIHENFYDIVCNLTYKEWSEKNENYKPFEDSPYYDKENEVEAFEKYINDNEISSMWKHLGSFEAGTLDNQCVVSASGDGDGMYLCYVGKNENNKIVSVKIDYYPPEEDY